MPAKVIKLPNDVFFKEAKTLIDEGRSVVITAAGDSMYPFFRNRLDEIKVEHCEDVRLNDVVVALTETNRYVAHRVVAIYGDNLTLMGDGNVSARELTTKSNVIGCVTAYRRKGESGFKPLYSLKWRVYSFLWVNALPVRKYLLAFMRYVLNAKAYNQQKDREIGT